MRLSVCPSVRNILFFLNLEESLLDFHQTVQTCSYMQDKFFRPKSKGKGPILLELFPFVVLNAGLPRSGKKFWKMKIFQVREKSGNYIFSQGNLKKMKKVLEKSGNFKIFLKRC